MRFAGGAGRINSLWGLFRHRSGIGLMSIVYFSLVFSGPVSPYPAMAHQGLHHDIERLTQLLTQHPQRLDLLLKRGHVYRLAGQLKASLRDLDRAYGLDRHHPAVALERGLTLAAMGQDEDAEAELSRVLQSGREVALAYAERGRLRVRRGHLELAIADFNMAIHLQPNLDLYVRRGRLQESLQHFDAAAAGYRDGLAQLGGAVVLQTALIRVETARGHYKAALQLVDDELARARVKSRWYLLQASVLKAAGREPDARVALEQALQEVNQILAKRPTSMHLMTRAKVYMAIGHLEAAKRDLRRAVRQTPRAKEAKALLTQLESNKQIKEKE